MSNDTSPIFTCPQCGNPGLHSAVPTKPGSNVVENMCTDCANDDRGFGRAYPPRPGSPRASPL